MSKQNKILIISTLLLIGIIGIVYMSVNIYRANKAAEIVKNTTEKIMELKVDIKNNKTVIENTTSILVEGEKEKLLEDLNSLDEQIPNIELVVKNAIVLRDSQEIRKVLEPNFTDPKTITPIENIEILLQKSKVVFNFCKERKQLRDRALHNEMTLKAVLKKPIEGIELPADLAEMSLFSPDCIKLVANKTDISAEKLPTLEPSLNNHLGISLIKARTIVQDVCLITEHQIIKNNAQEFWNSAHTTFLMVQPLNDKIHWYVPKQDDGKYDTQRYSDLLQQQKPALDALEKGNYYIERLNKYLDEVKNQYVIYISENIFEQTSFSHYRIVPVTKTRRVKHHDHYQTETYITTERQHYSTSGMRFYYVKMNIKPSGFTTEKIKVGEKDSYDSSNWQQWNYKTEETSGYLVEYKKFGTDNTFIVRGGTYNPSIHTLKK